ncbi:MAG: ABC transporter substrate-binding protein [Alphaproteobacteria bacterium]
MKKSVFAAALAATVFTVPAALAQQAPELRIGFINTFTGSGAVIGAHQKNGFDLAIEALGNKVGGLPTKVSYGDDQQKVEVGLQVADRFINQDKVHFIAGPIWSNILLAIVEPAFKANVFVISTNAGASPMAGEKCNPLFFSTSWNNDTTPEAMGQLMNEEKLDSVFMIAPNYQAGKDMLAGFQRMYKGKVSGQILFKPGATEFQAELSEIRAKKPPAVFVFAPGGMGIAFIKQWNASGIGKEVKLFSVFTVDHLTIPAIGEAAIGSYSTNFWDHESKNPATQKFIAAYTAKYKSFPSYFAAQAYDAPLLIDSGLKATKGNLDDKKALVLAMRKANFDSVRGPFTYNINHSPIQNYYKQTVVAGPDGKPIIRTDGVVFANHKDSYYRKCKMPY